PFAIKEFPSWSISFTRFSCFTLEWSFRSNTGLASANFSYKPFYHKTQKNKQSNNHGLLVFFDLIYDLSFTFLAHLLVLLVRLGVVRRLAWLLLDNLLWSYLRRLFSSLRLGNHYYQLLDSSSSFLRHFLPCLESSSLRQRQH